MTAQRYLRYLPDFVAEYAEFQKLGEIEGEILEEEAKAKQEMEQDQWILTATRKGLLRRAVMMGLFVSETEDTETLRERVLSYWNSRRPYTFFMMQEWLDTFCGAGNYQAKLDHGAYRLTIVLELKEKQKKEQILSYWKTLIPANLVFEVLLNTNTHGKVGALTHGELKESGWTYGEIPFADLSGYMKVSEYV